jgi:hypothetical protein
LLAPSRGEFAVGVRLRAVRHSLRVPQHPELGRHMAPAYALFARDYAAANRRSGSAKRQ